MQDAIAVCNGEEWLSVVGYEGWYEVSSFGRVRRTRSGRGTYAGRVLKPIRAATGYSQVGLRTDGKVTIHLIHWLVMAAFVGPRPHGMCVNHLDGEKGNNSLWNLEYTTPSGNITHAYMTGLREPANMILTPDQVRYIRSQRGLQSSPRLASILGVHPVTVRDIWQGRTWKSVT